MLKRFEVKNFKQFSHIILDFSNIQNYGFNTQCLTNGMIKTALIYGKNASGKTNIGLAIFDITCHLVDKQRGDLYSSYYLNADHTDQPAEFFYEFSFNDVTVRYRYKKIDANTLREEALDIDGELVFSYNYVTKEKHTSSIFGNLNWRFSDSRMSVLRYLANNTYLDSESPIYKLMDFVGNMLWFRRSDRENSYIGFKNNVETLVDFISERNLAKEFENFLNDFGVDEKLMLVKEPDGRNALYFEHAKQMIPFDMTASSGTQALYLFYYWYKQLNQVSFLFMDEFDAFYHPALAKKMLKLIIERVRQQTILTTHNVYLMNNDLMRPDCCFQINKNGLYSFADSTTRTLREGNNISKLYLSGEFDG